MYDFNDNINSSCRRFLCCWLHERKQFTFYVLTSVLFHFGVPAFRIFSLSSDRFRCGTLCSSNPLLFWRSMKLGASHTSYPGLAWIQQQAVKKWTKCAPKKIRNYLFVNVCVSFKKSKLIRFVCTRFRGNNQRRQGRINHTLLRLLALGTGKLGRSIFFDLFFFEFFLQVTIELSRKIYQIQFFCKTLI